MCTLTQTHRHTKILNFFTLKHAAACLPTLPTRWWRIFVVAVFCCCCLLFFSATRLDYLIYLYSLWICWWLTTFFVVVVVLLKVGNFLHFIFSIFFFFQNYNYLFFSVSCFAIIDVVTMLLYCYCLCCWTPLSECCFCWHNINCRKPEVMQSNSKQFIGWSALAWHGMALAIHTYIHIYIHTYICYVFSMAFVFDFCLLA